MPSPGPPIRDWLKRNPQQARDVMRKNERHIFFKDTKSQSASGSEGVPLTAQRSLAVDVTLTPYGTSLVLAPSERSGACSIAKKCRRRSTFSNEVAGRGCRRPRIVTAWRGTP